MGLEDSPILIEVSRIFDADICFDWKHGDVVSGRLSILKLKDGRVFCNTDAITKRYLRRLLHAAVDVLVENTKLED